MLYSLLSIAALAGWLAWLSSASYRWPYAKIAQRLDAPAWQDDTVYFPMPNADQWTPRGNEDLYSPDTWLNPFPMPACYGQVIEDATIDQLSSWLSDRTLTARQLVKCYLARIAQLNKWTNSVLETNPDALLIADQLDLESSHGKKRSSLHGIPFLVKDNIATADKMDTTGGSYALLGSRVPRDAHVVHLLREAGAVLLGKANCDEWACMRYASTCSAYSARGRQIRNIYNFTAHPWGSSGGSAQAVAANMAAFALGTETGGSITGPARRAGVVGLKPTIGRTSRAGIIPMTLNQDSVGPITRSIKDAAQVLKIMSGEDARDPHSLEVRRRARGCDQLHLPDTASPAVAENIKLGLPWKTVWEWETEGHAADMPVLRGVMTTLREKGALLVDGTEYPSQLDRSSDYHHSWWYRCQVDFFNDIAAYLSELKGTNLRSLKDLILYNNRFTDVEGGRPGYLPGFQQGQDGFLGSLATGGLRNETYWQSHEYLQRASRAEGIDAALQSLSAHHKDKHLYALLVPAASSSVDLPAQAGYPIVTIPVGTSKADGVPVAISVIGTACSEDSLVQIASWIESVVGRRLQPRFYNYWERNAIEEEVWRPK